jgi:hypothetical protein
MTTPGRALYRKRSWSQGQENTRADWPLGCSINPDHHGRQPGADSNAAHIDHTRAGPRSAAVPSRPCRSPRGGIPAGPGTSSHPRKASPVPPYDRPRCRPGTRTIPQSIPSIGGTPTNNGCGTDCWDPSATWVEHGRAAPAQQWAAAWPGHEAAEHCSTAFRGIGPTSVGSTFFGTPSN